MGKGARTRRRWTPVILLALLAGAGCSSGSDQRREEAAVRQDYLAYWNAYLRASEASDPDDAELNRRAGGSALLDLRAGLETSRKKRHTTRGRVENRIKAVHVDEEFAELIDCVDIDRWLLHDARTGRVVEDQLRDRPRQLTVYTLAEQDREWKVTQIDVQGEC